MQRFFDTTIKNGQPGEVKREEIYRHLNFPRGVDEPYPRPYTALNMVSTADGKVVIGGPGTTRLIGTLTDHYLMARIEAQADAVLLGAGLAREDDPPYPEITDERAERRKQLGLRPRPLWGVVSSRGEFARLPRVLEGGRANAALFVSEQIAPERKTELEKTCRVFVAGRDGVDPVLMGKIVRDELEAYRMICLGGPGLNATLLAAGAADELFLTLAPKLQGGRGMPTMVEGRGYPPAALPAMELLSLYADGGELYLRYRLPAAADLQMAPLAEERRTEPRLTVP